MDKVEFKFSDKTIILEELDTLSSSYKINIYKTKLEYMEKKNILQKPIMEVINHLFYEGTLISEKTKNSISKIIHCSKDKIIILITSSGKDIIWNRDKLINQYGWFFFVAEREKKQKPDHKKKKQKEQKKEEIISSQDFIFEDLTISLEEKTNMRSLYHTKEYFQYAKLIKSKNVNQMNILEVLNDLFNNNTLIPVDEKRSIRNIIYYKEEKVIVIKALNGDKMYDNLEKLVKKYGWYFYITGVPVGKSEISLAIDRIEKRYDSTYFNNISLSKTKTEKIGVSIYPIVLKPNHNCHILGLGDLNILIDCGISEYIPEDTEENEPQDTIFPIKKYNDFQHIIDYLENLPELIKEAEKREIQEEELTREDPELQAEEPEVIELKEVISAKPQIDAIFISHSHYDHVSGLKRLIEMYPDVPILCSRITLDLFLLRDSKFLKQESLEEIEEEEYRNIVKNVIYVENGEKLEFQDKNCYFSFFHAGHMPGALMILAKINDFRFLYTGDYTYNDITPFSGTKRFLEQISRPIDYLLIDGTSAKEDHGNISDQFHSLILFMDQKAEYQDNVLIGTDPSSLAITFMLTFWRYFRKRQLRQKGFTKRPNIYVDMMVRKNIQVINHRYQYIYGPISKLIKDKANPFNSIKFRWFGLKDLDFLRNKNNIIISHPPDLSYGIIRNIINVVGRNPHNLVYLAGSIHEEPGIDLINGAQEITFTDSWSVPFRAMLINTFAPQLQIKLHADKNQLAEMVRALEPKEVCFFHQSAKNLIEVVDYVKELGVEKVSLPKKRKLQILN